KRAELELVPAAQLAAGGEALLELVEHQELQCGVKQRRVLEQEVLRAWNTGEVCLDDILVDRLDPLIEEVIEDQHARATVVLWIIAAEHQGVVTIVRARNGLNTDRVIAARVDAARRRGDDGGLALEIVAIDRQIIRTDFDALQLAEKRDFRHGG